MEGAVVRWLMSRLLAVARLVLGGAMLCGGLWVADYLLTNSPGVGAARQARENAAAVAAAREIYARNGWVGMSGPDAEPRETDAGEIDAADCAHEHCAVEPTGADELWAASAGQP